jgi:hypothetical protein
MKDGLALHLMTSGSDREIFAAWERFLDVAFPEDGGGASQPPGHP